MNPFALDVPPGQTVVLDLTAEREDETEGLTGKVKLRLRSWSSRDTATGGGSTTGATGAAGTGASSGVAGGTASGAGPSAAGGPGGSQPGTASGVATTRPVYLFGAKGHSLVLDVPYGVDPPWRTWEAPVDDYEVSLSAHWRLPYELTFARAAEEVTPEVLDETLRRVAAYVQRAASDSRVVVTCRGYVASGEVPALAGARAEGVVRALAGRLASVSVRPLRGVPAPGDTDERNRRVDFVLTVTGPRDQPGRAAPPPVPAWSAVPLAVDTADADRYQIGGVYRLARAGDVGLWHDFNSVPGPAATFAASRFPDGASTVPDYSRARQRVLTLGDADAFHVLDVMYHAAKARRRSEPTALDRAYQCLHVETADGATGYVWSVYEGAAQIERVGTKCSVRQDWTTTVDLRAFKGAGAAFMDSDATQATATVESLRWLDEGLVPVEFDPLKLDDTDGGPESGEALAVAYRDDGVAWLRVRFLGGLPSSAPEVTYTLLHLKGNDFDAVESPGGTHSLVLEHALRPQAWKGDPLDPRAMLLKVGSTDLDSIFQATRATWMQEAKAIGGDPPVNFPLLNTVCLLASVRRGPTDPARVKAENLLLPAVQRLLFFLPGAFATALTLRYRPDLAPVTESWTEGQEEAWPEVALGRVEHDLLVCNRRGVPFRSAVSMNVIPDGSDAVGVPVKPIAEVAESVRRINSLLPRVRLKSTGAIVDPLVCEEIPYDWRLATDIASVLRTWDHAHEFKITRSWEGPEPPMSKLDSASPSEDEITYPFLADVARRLARRHEQLGASLPFCSAKVSVAAHSTGGAVLRGLAALETPFLGKLDQAFFINVPFLGAPKAEYVYLTGNPYLGLIVNEEHLRWIAPDMPIVYLLAPWSAYEALAGGEWGLDKRKGRLERAKEKGTYARRKALWLDPVPPRPPETEKELDFNDQLAQWAESYYLRCVAAEQRRPTDVKRFIFTSITDKDAHEGTILGVDVSKNPVRAIRGPLGDVTVPWLSAAHPALLWDDAVLMRPVRSDHTELLTLADVPGPFDAPNWVWRQVCRLLLGGPAQPMEPDNLYVQTVPLEARWSGATAIRCALPPSTSPFELNRQLALLVADMATGKYCWFNERENVAREEVVRSLRATDDDLAQARSEKTSIEHARLDQPEKAVTSGFVWVRCFQGSVKVKVAIEVRYTANGGDSEPVVVGEWREDQDETTLNPGDEWAGGMGDIDLPTGATWLAQRHIIKVEPNPSARYFVRAISWRT